ncbi:MAG: enoyl-CoA hydratase [Ferrovibrionaceae bacterium]
MTESLPGILTEIAGGVMTLTFNRPDKKNALTSEMYAALADGFAAAEADPAVRVILLTGAGGAFTAGNDLQDFLARPPQGDEAPVSRFLRALATTSKPLVAAVQGVAVGVGTTMLLHCDLVYAGESARLSMPFVNLGLVPEAASSLLLPRLAGHQKAAELLMFGEPIDARAAREIGLVADVFDDAVLVAEVRARTAKLAAKAPEALRLTKRLMKAPKATVAEQMAEEGALFRERLHSAEAREAFTAFMEKRAPRF